MTDTYLPFTRPTLDHTEIDEVVACLRSGWLTTGPRVAQFEQLLCEFFQREQVLALSSASAGLHLACLATDIGPGDEVITTPLTFVATANAISAVGARPVFVDICPDTLNMDTHQVAAAINARTKAIMPVHYAGLACDCDALYALAQAHGLRVIEDCAHAMGARYKGQRLGSFGDIQVFSFHPNKNMTTGEGGALVCNDNQVIERVKQLRFHGIGCYHRFAPGGKQHYDVVRQGFKYNMMDIQAAIGMHQLKKLDQFIHRRAMLADRYQGLLQNTEVRLQALPDYAVDHAWHLMLVILNPDSTLISRDKLIDAFKSASIGVGLHYQAVHLFSYYQKAFGYQRGDFPHAEAVADNILSLPLFPDMSEVEQDRVVHALNHLLVHKET